jgi:GT2 family glycosyltransferase
MLYIVTPVFNRKKLTQEYLEALSLQTTKDFKVIIVDDGSTDGTSEMIEEAFPDVILLKEEGDLWWSEATNVGIRYALNQDDADYIMTLNDDTIPYADYVEKMLFWSKEKPNALLGAFAVDIHTGETLYGGEIRYWSPLKDNVDLLDVVKEEDRVGLHEVNIFPGRGLLIPSQLFRDVGLYDSKNMPQTYADFDMTWRAVAKGYKIYCNHDARIKIYAEESKGKKLKKEKTLGNFYKHLFSIGGAGNLKFYTICAFKNSSKVALVPFLLKGWLARVGGYWIH